ncbi:hypothetical protein BDV32DRAFT_143210 [Aspergillus pseudonomiae]|uniref:non-specific serine/threonine protein kinase n=1 Tax=Aspergillus pseudonomiae TaxID=1506151 RepID=A0A5N6HJM5_9EURO|nr:uncharacterized protein BDV37DRAFT_295050 [Aspergillus pseudonomiae]KAB8254064.1 hypothetical protein BDV32DRAFT_143210 [Aspergillus pseudonomiae]KAE8402787.1 hypothetical protein BDV37DRAFT_295050 [Aspergillus pseudonomiae]
MSNPPGQSATAVPDNEEILSLDLEEDDFLYRIRRNSRIVLYSYRVLSKLRKILRWEEEWNTLTVRRSSQGVESSPNKSPPHGLDLRQIDIPDAIFVDLLDLTTVSRISDRISCVKHGRESRILKVARFKHEIPALQQEVAVYSNLTLSGFPHAPKFIGFVYEETKFRVVGFLIESITGKPPGVQNLRDYTETVRLLHAYGIVHGDLNKYNFLITEHGAKVFDFENAVVQGNVDPETAENEIETLAVKLEDESGIGKR